MVALTRIYFLLVVASIFTLMYNPTLSFTSNQIFHGHLISLHFILVISILVDPDHDREEMKRPKYLDQEKFSYIQNYLEKSEAHSVTTEPSDSGLPRSHGTLSELGMEEISGKIIYQLVGVNSCRFRHLAGCLVLIECFSVVSS